MELALIVLSFAVLISLIFIGKLYSKIEKIQDENKELKSVVDANKALLDKTLKDAEELVSIDPGDRAILPDYGLKQVDTNESFEVTYEVEIVEVAMDKVKVKAIGFTSNDRFAKDPKNKSSIINFLQDKWVKKKDIELIIDDSMRRDRKLQQILN
jgi:hypothetical protein